MANTNSWGYLNSKYNKHWVSGVLNKSKEKDGWVEELEKSKHPTIVSPLHDKDVNRKNDGFTRPHYHILIKTESQADISAITPILDRLNIKSLRVPRYVGLYLREMCGIKDFIEKDCEFEDLWEMGKTEHEQKFYHRSSALKDSLRECKTFKFNEPNYLYSIDDIIELNGADYKKLCFLPIRTEPIFNDKVSNNNEEDLNTLFRIIDEYQFFSLDSLIPFLEDNNLTIDTNWILLLKNNETIIRNYIANRYQDYRLGT